MNVYRKNYFQIKLILFFSIIKSLFSLKCNDFSFCFECITNTSCYWGNSECQEKNFQIENNKPYFNYDFTPEKCFRQNDIQTMNYIKTYCGNISYFFKDNTGELSFSLPLHNRTLYGANGLYCEYTIYNIDDIESFTVETKNNWGRLKMQIKYLFSDISMEMLLGDGDRNVIKDAEELKIIFESNSQKNYPPFDIKIIDTFKSINQIILLIIILCAFVVLIILIIIIICIRRRKRILIRNNINNNLNNLYLNNFNYNVDINNTDRIDFIGYLKKIKTMKFKEVQKEVNEIINTKCPIDIENFLPEDDVILTKCLHLFHYDCLKTFIEKNKTKKEFKCPLCNNPLFNSMIGEEIDNNNKLPKK